MKTVARDSMPVLLVASLVALVAGGCNRERDRTYRERPSVVLEENRASPNEQDRSGTTTLTGASFVANDGAIERIVASRCAREMACSNIGASRGFTSGEVCVREVGNKVRQDLSSSECPAGIDGKELDECLDAIRNESCSNPIEAIGRLAACRTGDLCLKTEMPHR